MKYLIIDLDDTILTSDKKITEYTKQGLEKARIASFIIVINTARSFKSALKYIDMIEPDYSILNGGCMIIDKDKNVIYKNLLDVHTVNHIIDMIKMKSITDFSIESENDLFTNNTEYTLTNPLSSYFDFNEKFPYPSYKVLISDTDYTFWDDFAKDNNLEIVKYLDSTWLRLSNSNKYLGNVELFKLLSDDNPIDYVFGDDYGDELMITNSKHGVVLINGREELKNKALHITEFDMNNDGVIRYLEKENLI